MKLLKCEHFYISFCKELETWEGKEEKKGRRFILIAVESTSLWKILTCDGDDDDDATLCCGCYDVRLSLCLWLALCLCPCLWTISHRCCWPTCRVCCCYSSRDPCCHCDFGDATSFSCAYYSTTTSVYHGPLWCLLLTSHLEILKFKKNYFFKFPSFIKLCEFNLHNLRS